MSEIKHSLEKLRAASRLLEQSDYSGPYSEEKIQSLRDALSEINDNVEQLKAGVNSSENSPIRCSK